MKKRLIGLAFVALGALTLASCGKSASTTIYTNNLTKGNSVDNISIEYLNNGKVDNITIKSSDTYDEVSEKIFNAFGSTLIGPKSNEKECYPYYEYASRNRKISSKNAIYREVEKDSSGKVNENRNGEYLAGDIETEETTVVNANALLSVYTDVNESFYLENYKYDEKKSYTSTTGTTVSGSFSDERLNKGQYYRFDGSLKGGTVEYASNEQNQGIRFRGSETSLLSEYGQLYHSSSWKTPNEYNATYKAEKNDIYFTNNDITINSPITVNYYPSSSYYGLYYIASMSRKNPFTSVTDDYYQNSFELTDKYLILKSKLNTSNTAIKMVEDMGLSADGAKDMLKAFEGSYYYSELWLNYKDTKIGDAEYSLSYDYHKIDDVTKQKSETLWSANTKPAYIDDAKFQSLGLDGKVYSNTAITENHYETYRIDVSSGEINSMKNDFINKCKNDNFLTKYNFTASSK